MPSHYPINSSSLGFTSSISSTAVGASAFVGGSSSSSYGRSASGAYGANGLSSSSGKDYEALGKLQDVVWSDEEEDPECPLCMEELDPSDVHFKPCVCGYQICRFCHNHIINNSNGLCPACRRSYHEQEAQFQPVDPEEMKRLLQAKTLKQKVNKQLETLGRLHYRDVRILVKNMIYVTGMKMMGGSTEEFLSTLRSNDYFGQYGKIAKVFLRKGPSTSDPTSGSLESSSDSDELGIYITYLRREDASRAIATLDGVSAPGNPGKTLKVTYGSTKYCLSWLRGVKCDEGSACLGAHDWAADNDTFTRKDMTTLQQAIKNSGTNMDILMQRQQRSTPKPAANLSTKPVRSAEETLDSSALPRTAHWAARPAPAASPSPLLANAAISSSSIPPKRPKAKVLSLSSNGAKPTLTTLGTLSKPKPAPAPVSNAAGDVERAEARNGVRASRSPSARHEEPVAAVPPPQRKSYKSESSSSPPSATSLPLSDESISAQPSTRSPSPMSDVSQAIPEVTLADPSEGESMVVDRARDTQMGVDVTQRETMAMAGSDESSAESRALPAPPPGLVPMPAGYPPTSPGIPTVTLTSESTHEQYQPSVQTQALMDDVISRREGNAPIYTVQSPYPDFEDVLAPFADGEFTYKLDVEMIIEVDDTPLSMTGVQDLLSLSNKMDGVRQTATYQGPFDPFLENQLDEAVQAMSGTAAGGDVKTSRFSFAKSNAFDGHSRSAMDYPSTSSSSPAERHVAPYATSHPYIMGKEALASATPPHRSALPFSIGSSSPAPNMAIPRTRTPGLAHAPPPPPGLGLPQQSQPHQQHPSFPLYQSMTGGQPSARTQHSGLSQQQHQLLTSLRDFHQPYVPERRTASPSLVQALRGGNASTQYGAREMYNPTGESFSIQDPAIMAIRSGFPGGDSQQRQPAIRNQMLEQFSLSYDQPSPYTQSQQLNGYTSVQHVQGQQQQPSQQDMTPNARLLQQMHEQMNAMAAGGNTGRTTPRSASRQAMSGRVY
ncbi:hypothetical protein NliqN6_3254 [Naganishia liquefaciens]|uniref:RING-type domain-containing protein n=1 Tax=Naganishia liquefaciens TaxID=104408 RepID=A0A8H3TTE7_9TREE|nr:hypothetical protein NliqN6_3254 [Naganishia liquefaciens]